MPKSTYPRIVEVFTPMVEEAAKHKIHLLVENEGSQNIATSAELGEFMPMLKSPWFGFNWDPNNAHSAKEIPFPDGYRKLPLDRMMNAQVKARDLLPDYPNDNLPWHDIMAAHAERRLQVPHRPRNPHLRWHVNTKSESLHEGDSAYRRLALTWMIHVEELFNHFRNRTAGDRSCDLGCAL